MYRRSTPFMLWALERNLHYVSHSSSVEYLRTGLSAWSFASNSSICHWEGIMECVTVIALYSATIVLRGQLSWEVGKERKGEDPMGGKELRTRLLSLMNKEGEASLNRQYLFWRRHGGSNDDLMLLLLLLSYHKRYLFSLTQNAKFYWLFTCEATRI